ncbi:hypothetical protein VNO78_09982 [Psophocarpus tetragonolobus]|uniref:Uncharacterized protein n=1 Tax=Psophocarpus tetragonolobus TaxID=3891 RepID=A0AAN9SQ61_PSOTE
MNWRLSKRCVANEQCYRNPWRLTAHLHVTPWQQLEEQWEMDCVSEGEKQKRKVNEAVEEIKIMIEKEKEAKGNA